MEIYVQKFGGTSVATENARECVYKKIIDAKKKYTNLVVIVSAMGREGEPYATDTLLNILKSKNENVSKRELDAIYSCGEIISASLTASSLSARGYQAISLTGQQAGIITDNNHFDAEVLSVNTDNIIKYLEKGWIPIIAGSQGATDDGEITTLGRGGSDISAVVIGNALNAERIDIYTDVEGVMTADPNLIEGARLLESIDYKTCMLLSDRGAKVIHPRAVKIAQKNKNTRLFIKSTFSSCEGTCIRDCDKNISGIQSITMQKYKFMSQISLVGNNIDRALLNKVRSIISCSRINYKSVEISENHIGFCVNESKGLETVQILHRNLFSA